MQDTDELQIININIDSIDAEDVGDSEQNINTGTVQESNTKQETHGTVKCCANTDSNSKSTNNGTKSMVDATLNKPIKYFLVGPSCDTDQRKSVELTKQIHMEFKNVFNGIGCFEGTFSLQF